MLLAAWTWVGKWLRDIFLSRRDWKFSSGKRTEDGTEVIDPLQKRLLYSPKVS
jgi:hypothetical protein